MQPYCKRQHSIRVPIEWGSNVTSIAIWTWPIFTCHMDARGMVGHMAPGSRLLLTLTCASCTGVRMRSSLGGFVGRMRAVWASNGRTVVGNAGVYAIAFSVWRAARDRSTRASLATPPRHWALESGPRPSSPTPGRSYACVSVWRMGVSRSHPLPAVESAEGRPRWP